MAVLLKAHLINKTYTLGKNNTNQVLRNVSLEIDEGEFVSVMGPSGSGKSTLLYNVSGMDRVTGGYVTFMGIDIAKLSEKELAELRLTKMGFVFQQSNLLKNLSVLDNIIVSAFLNGRESKTDINNRAMALMVLTGIAHLKDNDITQASGGELQRAAICRALINQPVILFADEPTGALNSKSANEVMEIFTEINDKGTTVMLVTHDAKVASRTERVLFMTDGVIAGEIRLGKHQNDGDTKARESRLAEWLSQMGF